MRHDFSKVRVHTDNEAVQMNQKLGARAFTHGRDIYFGAGQNKPQSTAGERLLAHELTHVVQQTDPQHMEGKRRSLTPAPTHIQRKLVLTGNAAHVARAIAVMNAGIDSAMKPD